MEKDEQFLAACKQGDFIQFYKLITDGADVNYKNGEPLREAITNNHVIIWTSLLDNSDINLMMKDGNGRSALHVACWYNKVGRLELNWKMFHTFMLCRRQQYPGC